jgi:hypothetical protein
MLPKLAAMMLGLMPKQRRPQTQNYGQCSTTHPNKSGINLQPANTPT